MFVVHHQTVFYSCIMSVCDGNGNRIQMRVNGRGKQGDGNAVDAEKALAGIRDFSIHTKWHSTKKKETQRDEEKKAVDHTRTWHRLYSVHSKHIAHVTLGIN